MISLRNTFLPELPCCCLHHFLAEIFAPQVWPSVCTWGESLNKDGHDTVSREQWQGRDLGSLIVHGSETLEEAVLEEQPNPGKTQPCCSRDSRWFPLGHAAGSWSTLLVSWLIILPSLQTHTEIPNSTAAGAAALPRSPESLPDGEIAHYPPNSRWAGKKSSWRTSPDTGGASRPAQTRLGAEEAWGMSGDSAALLACRGFGFTPWEFILGETQPRTGTEQQLGDQTLQKKENHSDNP